MTEPMAPVDLPGYDEVSEGDLLPPLVMPAISRHTLAVYCGASGDHNPVHVDIDFARAAGLDDVIAHGMLVMAYTGRMLTRWVPQDAIREFDTRFLAMTHVGDEITATGRIAEKFVDGADGCVRIELAASDQHGEAKTRGTALVVLA